MLSLKGAPDGREKKRRTRRGGRGVREKMGEGKEEERRLVVCMMDGWLVWRGEEVKKTRRDG